MSKWLKLAEQAGDKALAWMIRGDEQAALYRFSAEESPARAYLFARHAAHFALLAKPELRGRS